MIILLERIPQNTQECVSELNDKIGGFGWKRKTKFKLKDCKVEDVRVFFTEEKNIVATIIRNKIYLNIDLSNFLPLIKRIEEVGKNFYTWDYGEVYFNPYDFKLHIVCGDGGYFYSDLPYSKIKKLEEEGELYLDDFDNFKDFGSFEDLECITDIEYADEYYPTDDNDVDEIKFIHITNINSF